MNAGEVAKIYSIYPDQQQADTALQTTMRNDFGYTGGLPQSVLAAINPSTNAPPAQAPMNNPQTPPATSALMPPSVVPQPQAAAPRPQEYTGTPFSPVQQDGASRQQPVQGQGQGQGRQTRGPDGFQQLMQMVEQLRQRGMRL